MSSMLKPSSCQGCPFYTYGSRFTPDTMIPNSEVLFIAQNPGPDEELGHRLIKRHWLGQGQHHDEYEDVLPQPLIGATGQLFDKRFLPLSGLKRSEVSTANAIRCRPGFALGLTADSLPPLTNKMKLETSDAAIVRALKHCASAHLHIPTSVKLIVTMGQYGLYQQTGISNVQDWRGYGFGLSPGFVRETIDTSSYHNLAYEPKLFVTMHIAALFKGENKRYMHAVLQDFHKIRLILRGIWPVPLPTWSNQSPKEWPSYGTFDTEYNMNNNDELIRWSLCDTNNNLYCVESSDTPSAGIPIKANSTVVIQNALADIAHLSRIVDISSVKLEDMMLAHSVLWTGEPHSLNYIASVYGAFNRYKHLSSNQPQLYSALDAYEPMHIWKTHCLPEFRNDPLSWAIYKKYRLPLIDIINKAQLSGVKINSSRLRQVKEILESNLEKIRERARVITGNNKFNIGGSKQLKEILYD